MQDLTSYNGILRKEAERLILQARRDLAHARNIIGIEAYEVVAFLCHQAVQKYLEGVWIQKKRARRVATHYLRELG
ncbi:MAG: HEPN domain-containing protein [Candidatus Rokubacteria bacterium]|nr:HEPN domain-containing protein [Candidatus Rokubacteria bacterium]